MTKFHFYVTYFHIPVETYNSLYDVYADEEMETQRSWVTPENVLEKESNDVKPLIFNEDDFKEVRMGKKTLPERALEVHP